MLPNLLDSCNVRLFVYHRSVSPGKPDISLNTRGRPQEARIPLEQGHFALVDVERWVSLMNFIGR